LDGKEDGIYPACVVVLVVVGRGGGVVVIVGLGSRSKIQETGELNHQARIEQSLLMF
jgi:hypothetical protein